ncbi:type B 50S ribosomal protein L31, partial [Ochrobactrum sp. POC9]
KNTVSNNDKRTVSAVLFCFLKSTAVFMFQTHL